MKTFLALALGFGLGVWFEYLNVLFWKNHAKNKYSPYPKEVSKDE